MGDSESVTRKLAHLSATKAPVLTRSDILECGMSRGALQRALADGVFVRVGRGIFTPATKLARAEDDPVLRHALEAAAVLTRMRKRDAVVSHKSAARLHRLDLLDRPQEGLVTLTRPRGSNNNGPAHIYIAALPETHITHVHNIPVVTAARAVHDVAREHGFADGLVAADSMLRPFIDDPGVLADARAELLRVTHDCRGWPGSVTAARVARYVDGRSESALESLSRAVIIDSHLPMPEIQVWLPELPHYRVDFLWPEQRVIAEADGLIKYASNPHRIGEEKIRIEKIREAGYEMVHYICKEMRHHRETVIARLDAAFGRAKLLGYG